MRIALLGGSFDPPHLGHLLAATEVLLVHEPDEVWLAPCVRHPFGKSLAPFADRLAMTALAAAPLGPRVLASEIEAEVAAAGGGGTTVELLRFLRDRRPDDRLILVVGADILLEAARWSHWDEIGRLAERVVINRTGFPPAEGGGPPLPEIASTELRSRLARGESLAGLVPAAVDRYLREKRLYRR